MFGSVHVALKNACASEALIAANCSRDGTPHPAPQHPGAARMHCPGAVHAPKSTPPVPLVDMPVAELSDVVVPVVAAVAVAVTDPVPPAPPEPPLPSDWKRLEQAARTSADVTNNKEPSRIPS